MFSLNQTQTTFMVVGWWQTLWESLSSGTVEFDVVSYSRLSPEKICICWVSPEWRVSSRPGTGVPSPRRLYLKAFHPLYKDTNQPGVKYRNLAWHLRRDMLIDRVLARVGETSLWRESPLRGPSGCWPVWILTLVLRHLRSTGIMGISNLDSL